MIASRSAGVALDERVGDQRPQRDRVLATDRRLDRQQLVRLDVLDQAEHLGGQRRGRDRRRAGAVDARRDLDDRVVGQVRDRAAVVRVDDVDRAVARVERLDERRGRLAVVRAAAPLQQLGLAVQRRVAVEVEQLALDADDVGRPAGALALLAQDVVGRVVVAQVVGRDRAERPDDRRAGSHRPAVTSSSPASSSSGRRSTPSTRTARIHDRWLRPTWSSETRSGVDAEVAGEPALEPDRHVAQPDGAMPGVQQRLGDDPHRVGEVEDPRPGRAAPRGLLGDLEDQRHRAQGLREPAGPGRLLADEAELAAAASRPPAARPGRRPAAG